MQPLIRYNGVWMKVDARPGEPERTTSEIVWMLLDNKTYADWFERERTISKRVYNE
jgi:hypothetical protein